MSEENRKKRAEKVADGKMATDTVWYRKLLRTFIVTDIRTVAKDAWDDVIVPGIKSTLWNGIGSMLGVDIRPSKKGRTDYGKYSSGYKYGSRDHRRDDDDDRNFSGDYRDIIFDTKTEAERVLDELIELANEYDQASITDLFDLAGMSAYNRQFTNNAWGWPKGSLDDARTRRVSGGYELVLPKERSLE